MRSILFSMIGFFILLKCPGDSPKPKRIFIDCGFNQCIVLEQFIKEYPDYTFFGFEVIDEDFIHQKADEIRKKYPDKIEALFFKAVWIENAMIDIFQKTIWGANYKGGTTVLKGKKKNEFIAYDKPIPVEAIDFSRWIAENFSLDDDIIIKMDIEGAEYPVIEKMYNDGTLKYINKIYIEFHYNQFTNISKEYHQKVKNMILKSGVKLILWH